MRNIVGTLYALTAEKKKSPFISGHHFTEINEKRGATRELKRDLSVKSCFDLSCPDTCPAILWYVVMNCMLF